MVEPFFPDVIPDMLHRMQLRTLGGLGAEANILWDLEGRGHVPPSAIDLHHDEVVRQCLGDMVEEEIHHGCVRRGQN
jgi:hypothetical protein